MPSFRGSVHILRHLLTDDKRHRRELLYNIGMKLRGIDLDKVGIEALGLSSERSNLYSNSGGPGLDVVLQSLSISEADAALDLGCGKGGAILTMAKYPFSRVDGVEISPALVKIAQTNLARAKLTKSSIFCCDAAEFRDFDRYTFLYMYNPFPENVVRAVIANVVSSLARRPRVLTHVYRHPLCHELFVNAGFRKNAEFCHGDLPYYVYTIAGRPLPEPMQPGQGRSTR